MTSDNFRQLLDLDIKVESCYKCPFVKKGRCHAVERKYGRRLSREIYSVYDHIYGGFMEGAGRDPNCPLPITVKPGE